MLNHADKEETVAEEKSMHKRPVAAHDDASWEPLRSSAGNGARLAIQIARCIFLCEGGKVESWSDAPANPYSP